MREIRKRAVHVLPAVVGAAIVGYFSYHAIQGEHGLYSYMKINREMTDAKAELAGLQAEKNNLERKVSSLRPSSLDVDLLEERARAVLNLMRDDELFVPFKER